MEDRWKTRNEGTNDKAVLIPLIPYYWDKPDGNGYEIMYTND